MCDALTCEEVGCDDAGEYEVEWAEEFEAAGEQDAFLAFFQAGCAECALDDLLIGTPVEKVEQQDARKEGVERCVVSGCADGVKGVGRCGGLEGLEVLEDVCVGVDGLEAKKTIMNPPVSRPIPLSVSETATVRSPPQSA